MKQKIKPQKQGSLNEAERLEMARLLVKAGYTVRIGREKPPGKTSGAIITIEFWEEEV